MSQSANRDKNRSEGTIPTNEQTMKPENALQYIPLIEAFAEGRLRTRVTQRLLDGECAFVLDPGDYEIVPAKAEDATNAEEGGHRA